MRLPPRRQNDLMVQGVAYGRLTKPLTSRDSTQRTGKELREIRRGDFSKWTILTVFGRQKADRKKIKIEQ